MKAADIEAALNARPFRPFELRVDGEVIKVQCPEQVFLAEKQSTVIVDTGDRIHIMDVGHVSKLTLPRPRARSR